MTKINEQPPAAQSDLPESERRQGGRNLVYTLYGGEKKLGKSALITADLAVLLASWTPREPGS